MGTIFASRSFPRPSRMWAMGYRPPRLGQGPDIDSLTQGIRDLLREVPPEVLGTYQGELSRCERLVAQGGVTGLLAGGKCLYELFQDLKAVVEERRRQQPPAAPPATQPPPSGFPVLPVALAAAAGLALVYAVTQASGG